MSVPREQGMVKSQLEIVEVENPHSVLTYEFCIVHWLFNVPGLHNKYYWTLKTVKLGVQDESQPSKWSQMIYHFFFFPLFLLFRMARKVQGLTKYTF